MRRLIDPDVILVCCGLLQAIAVQRCIALPMTEQTDDDSLFSDLEKDKDAVHSLPGWKGKLPNQWYSGYIKLDDEMFSHYIYVKRDPSPDAKAAPIVLWSNGGPGASSMFGIMTELGPFMLSEESLQTEDFKKTGVPSLIRNPSSWTSFADLVMFDWPPPVGFSYCMPAGPTGNGTSCGAWDDSRVAQANFAALSGFFDKFPDLRSRDLYLTGESYAGVYIPMLAREILKNSKGKMNLKGFAVGDACTGTEVVCGDSFGPYWHVEFMQGHQQFSRKLYNNILETCGLEALQFGPLSPPCDALIKEMHAEIGGYYAYSLYDDCTYDNAFTLAKYGALPGHLRWGQGQHGGPPQPSKRHASSQGLRGGLNDYPCGTDRALSLWAARKEVRAALNVAADANFFNNDNGHGFTYEVTEANLMPFYRDVAVGMWADVGLRVLVYNGDTDPSINPLVVQNWTAALGLAEREKWRPWTVDGCRRMGGYVTRYEGQLDFLTVRGSGHMVPTYKPEAARAFMGAWIAGQNYPAYDSSCKKPGGTSMHSTEF